MKTQTTKNSFYTFLTNTGKKIARKARNAIAGATILAGSLAGAYAQEEQKQPTVPPPTYLTQKKTTTAETPQDLSTKAILNGNAYFDSETKGATGTAKGILDFGNCGLDIYGNSFLTRQDFDEYKIDGDGARAWAGIHAYFPLARDLVLYGAAAGGLEKRIYTIKFDNDSEDFDFGNRSPFATATIGIAQGRLNDPDNFGVGNDMNRLLIKATWHNGSAEGDVEEHGYGDDYEARRYSAEGRFVLFKDVFAHGDSLAATGGIASLCEKIGNFLKQNHVAGEAGMRWNLPDHTGYVEPGVVIKDVESTLAGSKTTDKLVGPQLKTGLRIYRGNTVTIDATLEAGYLSSKKSDDQWYIAPGLTVWLGKKSK
ncbi:MAG: hypothetical protein QXR48_01725 [Candidatus Woesearchaeota archaeon]